MIAQHPSPLVDGRVVVGRLDEERRVDRVDLRPGGRRLDLTCGDRPVDDDALDAWAAVEWTGDRVRCRAQVSREKFERRPLSRRRSARAREPEVEADPIGSTLAVRVSVRRSVDGEVVVGFNPVRAGLVDRAGGPSGLARTGRRSRRRPENA